MSAQTNNILSLLKELEVATWSNLSTLDSEVRLETALQLLKIVDILHMGNALDQNKLYNEAEKLGIHIQRPDLYSPLPTLSKLPDYVWNKKWNEGID